MTEMATIDKRKRLARKLQNGGRFPDEWLGKIYEKEPDVMSGLEKRDASIPEDMKGLAQKKFNWTSALSSLKGLAPDLNKDRSGLGTEYDSAVFGDMGSDPVGRLMGDLTGRKMSAAVGSIRDGVSTFDKVRNNDSLANAWGDVQLKKQVDASFKGSDILDNLEASGQGAINGLQMSGGNPWAALAGGIVGGVTNLASQLSRGRRAKELNSAIAETNRQTLENYYGQAMANTQDSIRNAYKYGDTGYAAYGGRIYQHGGLMGNPNGLTNGVTEFNTGGTHEQNPYGGIQQGIASDGIPNLVEEGEVKYKDYIYSARLHATKKLLDEYNLPKKYEGMTFGEIARSLQKGSDERANDPISLNGLNASMQRLADAQEKVRGDKKRKELKRALDRMTPEQMQAMQASVMESMQQQPGMEGMYGMQGMQPMGDMQQMPPMEGMYAEGGNIHIAPSKRGTFTEAARRHGMGVQEFARHVLANKESYSPSMIKKANFAHNAAGWSHQDGGPNNIPNYLRYFTFERDINGNKNPFEFDFTKRNGVYPVMGLSPDGVPLTDPVWYDALRNPKYTNGTRGNQYSYTSPDGFTQYSYLNANNGNITDYTENRDYDWINNQQRIFVDKSLGANKQTPVQQTPVQQSSPVLRGSGDLSGKPGPRRDGYYLYRPINGSMLGTKEQYEEQAAEQELLDRAKHLEEQRLLRRAPYVFEIFDRDRTEKEEKDRKEFLKSRANFQAPENFNDTRRASRTYDKGNADDAGPIREMNLAAASISAPAPVNSKLSTYERTGKNLKDLFSDMAPAQRAKLLSHIPVYASEAQVLADSMGLTNRKDYSASNELRRISGQYAPVAAPLIGGRKGYENVDTNLPVANAYANAAAIRNALSNTANGNRANLAAALSRYNQAATEAAQRAYMDAQAANLSSRNRIDDYNQKIDLANSGIVSDYDKMNLAQRAERLKALQTAAMIDDQMLSSRNAALQSNRDQMIRNLGELGKEGLNEAMVVAMAERGLFGAGMASYLKDLGFSQPWIAQLEKVDAEAKRKRGEIG